MSRGRDGAESPKLQPLTRARLASLGAAGQAWASRLPTVLDELEQQWSIQVGRALSGGSSSYVARVRCADGQPAVLKVAASGEGLEAQADTLARADGRGYARLLAVDLDRQALLLEALGRPLQASGRSPESQLELLADTLRLAWRDVSEVPARNLEDKAAGLHDLIARLWRELERPCPEAVVRQALRYAESLIGVAEDERVVVHGDPHPGNALRVAERRPGAETGYCFVDPDGFVADPAYDLGVALRDWCGQLLAGDARATASRYCQVLADRSGVDVERIWRWGFVERVSTGLYVLSFGAESVARPFLDSAALLTGV